MRRRRIFLSVSIIILLVAIGTFVACSILGKTHLSGGNSSGTTEGDPSAPRYVFDADSAYSYCAAQCSFGPRTMNTAAHEACGEWIKEQFAAFGLTVESQRATLRGYDDTPLKAENIIARLNPQAAKRLLLCAHWDSRPWADNDANPDNHHTPVMAANDGASGVAVLLELARMLTADSVGVAIGVDFVCFDAEDYGTPQWAEESETSGTDTWALGSQHWARTFAADDNSDAAQYEYGILVDMVGGEGARFYEEGLSQRYAPQIVKRVWQAARTAGYASFFPTVCGAYVTDDHVYVNEWAGIKCVDIIAHYPSCPQSSFGPTWHTVDDTMEHISLATLQAVGQTIATLLAEY